MRPRGSLRYVCACASVRAPVCARVVRREDDATWPEPDQDGRQELEVVMGGEHISFTVRACAAVACVYGVTSPQSRSRADSLLVT